MYFKIIISILIFYLNIGINYAQIGIGTTVPDKSAIVEVKSNSKGFLIPRMTESERDLIASPAEGLLMYCTDCCTTGRISFYSTEWELIVQCNAAPTVSSLTITGTPQEDEVIKAEFTYADTENDAEGDHTFQWYRADDTFDLNRIAIPSATDSTYTLTTDDVSKYIQYTIIPVALTGTSPGVIDTSGYSDQIIAIPPAVIEIPEGNFSSGDGSGGSFAQHIDDVDYPTLFNGDSVTDDNRFHEGDFIDITFSTPSNPILIPADYIVKVFWHHNGDNKSWGVYTTFYNDATVINTEEDGPITGVVSERVLVATTTAPFNRIRVGAISTGDGGFDARIREIDILRPDGTELTITVNP